MLEQACEEVLQVRAICRQECPNKRQAEGRWAIAPRGLRKDNRPAQLVQRRSDNRRSAVLEEQNGLNKSLVIMRLFRPDVVDQSSLLRCELVPEQVEWLGVL